LWLRLSEYGDIACIYEPLIKLRRTVMSYSYNIQQEPYILFKLLILACYLRRKKGFYDPHWKKQNWGEFVRWVSQQMETLGCFRKGKAQRELYRIWYSKKNYRLSCLFEMLRYILSQSETRAFLLDRLYLTNAAAQIAVESETLFVN